MTTHHLKIPTFLGRFHENVHEIPRNTLLHCFLIKQGI